MIKKISIFVLSSFIFLSNISPVKAIEQNIIPLEQHGIESQHYILYDRSNKSILSEKNAHEKVHPASITKALTLITAIEMIEDKDFDKTIKVDPEIFNGLDPIASLAGFEANEEITLRDAFYGLMLPSGADASRIISHYLSGSPEGLNEYMNQKAKEIGMKNSNFVNTSGLDDENHLSTAYDLALLIDYSLNNDLFREIYESRTYTSSKTKEHPDGIEFVDLNLEYADKFETPIIKGAKSGYTELAQRSLSSYAQKDKQELIFISIFNPSREDRKGPVDDAIIAYDRAFNDYKLITAINKNTIFDSLEIKNANDFDFVLDEDINVYIPKDLDLKDLKVEIKNKPEGLVAPLEAKTALGTLEISYNDKIIYRQPMTNKEEIKIKFTKVLWDFMKVFLSILAIAIAFVLVFLYLFKSFTKYKLRNS